MSPLHAAVLNAFTSQGWTYREVADLHSYTAWRDGHRVGVARLVDGELRVEADDAKARYALLVRLEADARAAGIPGFADESAAA